LLIPFKSSSISDSYYSIVSMLHNY
jgi:hypothetical protein